MDVAALQGIRLQRARAAGWTQSATAGGGWQWFHPGTGQTLHSTLDPLAFSTQNTLGGALPGGISTPMVPVMVVPVVPGMVGVPVGVASVIPPSSGVASVGSGVASVGSGVASVGSGAASTFVMPGQLHPTQKKSTNPASSAAGLIEKKRKELLQKQQEKEEAERLARLPPALRKRLEARGVIKKKVAATSTASEADGGDSKGGDEIDGDGIGSAKPAAPAAAVPPPMRPPPPPKKPAGPAASVPGPAPSPKGAMPPPSLPAKKTSAEGANKQDSHSSAASTSTSTNPFNPVKKNLFALDEVMHLPPSSGIASGMASSSGISSVGLGGAYPESYSAKAASVFGAQHLEDLPLPRCWQKCKYGGRTFFWHPLTGERTYKHPGEQAGSGGAGGEQDDDGGGANSNNKMDKNIVGGRKIFAFEEMIKVTEGDLGRLIGKNGGNLKLLKCSLGEDESQILCPKKGSKPDSKALNGRPTFTVKLQGCSEGIAKKGKRAVDLFLASQKPMAECIREAGLTVKKPPNPNKGDDGSGGGQGPGGPGPSGGVKRPLNQIALNNDGSGTQGGSSAAGAAGAYHDPYDSAGAWAKRMKPSAASSSKDKLDMMDPSSYSDAPLGGWGAGLKTTAHGDDVDFQQYR
ncbi:unnamed protein product [Amoebophrya sp. A25]|nr:unnamed protein product [Amoebophrya sp. A25]|eukprot:GSA25T00006738001.1